MKDEVSIYEDIVKTMYDKHKGHNFSKEYRVEGHLDFKIAICKDCDIAILYNPDDDDL